MRNNGPQDALRHNGVNRVFSQLAAQKKKSVTALCLIAVMVLMWVRVLGKKTPEAAEATSTIKEINLKEQSKPELKISFVELPKAPGRNDVITRDFFASNGWSRFGEVGKIAGSGEVSVVSKNGSEEIARRVAEKLKLEAIGVGENPQAFINGKPLSVGGKLLIGDTVAMFVCEVVEIQENEVLIRCGEAEITLKLKKQLK